jgi:hypothetical protein
MYMWKTKQLTEHADSSGKSFYIFWEGTRLIPQLGRRLVWKLLGEFTVSPGEFRDSNPDWDATAPFHTLSNPSLACYPNIRRSERRYTDIKSANLPKSGHMIYNGMDVPDSHVHYGILGFGVDLTNFK